MRSVAAVASLALLLGGGTPAAGVGSGAPAAAHKRALLIGAARYTRGGNPANEWWDLSSDTDVRALREMLGDRFGFAPADIVMLTSRAETTRGSILAAFEQLIARTMPGDVVFIHYSGHGTQVLDRNGDEADGLDEALIPSDYVSRQDASRSILDDEIGALLTRLRARRPASVLLTFDSCFSGTQARGGRLVVRGASYEGPRPAAVAQPEGVHDALDLGAAGAGYVAIAAAREDQLSYQVDDGAGGSIGLLTYALLKTMQRAGPDTTYRELFEDIFDTMTNQNPGQTPQLEGDLDTRVMNGTAAVPASYVPTRIVPPGHVLLEQGALHGVTRGSRYALYPAGTRKFSRNAALTVAEVTAVTPTTSMLSAAGPVDRFRLARAIEVEHKYADPALRLEDSFLANAARARELQAQIKTLVDKGRIVESPGGTLWDLKICGNFCPSEVRGSSPSGAAAAMKLVRRDGTIAAALPDSADLGAALTRAIERETRWRMIANLDRDDPKIGIQVRAVPVDATMGPDGKVLTAVPRRAPPFSAGKPSMMLGDYFMVELRNTGAIDAYVTVVDLSPDGSINPIWPHPDVPHGQDENLVKAGDTDAARAGGWRRLPLPFVFQVGPPAGSETLKAIATDVPADFSALLTKPAENDSRGTTPLPDSPIARLLSSAFAPARRGPSLAAAPPSAAGWAASSFTFVVDEAKRR